MFSSTVLRTCKHFPSATAILVKHLRSGRMPASVSRHWMLDALEERVLAEHPILVQNGDCKFYVPHRFLFYYGRHGFEPITHAALLDVLRPGAVVVDVGAHIGSIAILSATRVGPQGRVYAVEPDPASRRMLVQSILANDFSNVIVLPYAAGSVRRKREFRFNSDSLRQGFVAHPHQDLVTVRTETIEEVPLDDVVLAPVDVVKIDVDGTEIDVLDGMARLVHESPALAIVVEWNPMCMRASGRDPLDLPARLEAWGFTKITVLDDLAGRSRNLASVKREVASRTLNDRWYANLLALR